MTTDLTGAMLYESKWDHQDDTRVAVAQDKNTFTINTKWTYGTGNGQINEMFRAQYVLAPGTATVDIDLKTLTNIFGQSFGFNKVREVVVANRSSDASDAILVGAAAANAWTAPFNGSATAQSPVHALGTWSMCSPNEGFTVTAGSKTLRLSYSAGSESTIDVVIKGVKD